MSRIVTRIAVIIATVMTTAGALLFAPILQMPGITAAQATPTRESSRLSQPPTVYPPAQADHGEQTFWGKCSACHGDGGQGLTDEWRETYGPEMRDCWQAGCHASDHPQNSFEIPKTGIPPITGTGALARFTNTFELQQYIKENMPLVPAGSLTTEESLALAAFILRMNDHLPDDLALSEENAAAISVHRKEQLPENPAPATLIMAAVLILAAVGIVFRAKYNDINVPALNRKPNFIHHLHPPTIPAEQAKFRYTLGTGGLAVFLSLILLATGLLELYYYIPSPNHAAVSVETITTLVPFGSLVRNLHYWSAQFLVVVMTIHLLRVVLTGAYAPPRRFNFILGLGLLVLILLLDFTGYVLRWDNDIRWALVIGTNLLKTIPAFGDNLYRFIIGGSAPGSPTLIRFYAWHIFGLTMAMAFLLGWHIFRVRRDGGIAAPPPAQRNERVRITRFELLSTESVAMLIAGGVLLLFAIIVPAPIGQPLSTVSSTMGSSRAPWFFLWMQQLLKFGDPFLMGILIPVLAVVLMGLIPYILPLPRPDEMGRWFPSSNRAAQIFLVIVLAAILVLTCWGALAY